VGVGVNGTLGSVPEAGSAPGSVVGAGGVGVYGTVGSVWALTALRLTARDTASDIATRSLRGFIDSVYLVNAFAEVKKLSRAR
jgi:hypothetical protein